MKGILLVTHHILAEAFQKTSEMLIGTHNFIYTLGLEEGQTPEAFQKSLQKTLNHMKTQNHYPVLAMTDLYGGTPCNQTLLLLQEYDISIVPGLNLPMLLQTALLNSDAVSMEELVTTAVESGKEAVFDVAQLFHNFNK